MLIRRDDFKEIEKLTKGSHKKVWFTCDWCRIGVLQPYKTYLKTKTDLCRNCRNKETATNPEVKKKQSKKNKKKWKDPEYRNMMSIKLSKACKEKWDNDDGTRRELISGDNNPMKRKEIRDKVALSESVSNEEIKTLLSEFNYEFISKKLGLRGGAVITFKCDNGHVDNRRLDAIRHGSRCRYCNYASSQGERELREWILSLIDNERVIFNDRQIISPYEIDILIDNKIGIEYNGLYWHSEDKGKNKKYHLTKTEMCQDKGIRIIHIFEDEWQDKKDIVKNRLSYILKLTNNEKIYARKCKIDEIKTKEAKNFCEINHIQGYGNSKIKLGLYYNDRLVSVMTFSRPNISKGGNPKDKQWELNRFCSSCNVIGGFSKLLEYFKNNYDWNCIFSYVDRRWNSGDSYKKIGFELIKTTKPNYWYCKTIKNNPTRVHRFNFRRSLLEGRGTEKEIMKSNGWSRIWDCGSLKYVIYK